METASVCDDDFDGPHVAATNDTELCATHVGVSPQIEWTQAPVSPQPTPSHVASLKIDSKTASAQSSIQRHVQLQKPKPATPDSKKSAVTRTLPQEPAQSLEAKPAIQTTTAGAVGKRSDSEPTVSRRSKSPTSPKSPESPKSPKSSESPKSPKHIKRPAALVKSPKGPAGGPEESDRRMVLSGILSRRLKRRGVT